MRLVTPSIEHEEMWKNWKAEFAAAGEPIVPWAARNGDGSYASFLQITADFERENTMPTGLVPSSTYFAQTEDLKKIAGIVSIRHRLNDNLLKTGGHIGYGVAPSERRKGYATKMLALALEKCRELGLERVLVTCDKNNIGSAKTILKNGGILENEYTEDNGNVVQRYWIAILK